MKRPQNGGVGVSKIRNDDDIYNERNARHVNYNLSLATGNKHKCKMFKAIKINGLVK
jgi:hypothetical protein